MQNAPSRNVRPSDRPHSHPVKQAIRGETHTGCPDRDSPNAVAASIVSARVNGLRFAEDRVFGRKIRARCEHLRLTATQRGAREVEAMSLRSSHAPRWVAVKPIFRTLKFFQNWASAICVDLPYYANDGVYLVRKPDRVKRSARRRCRAGAAAGNPSQLPRRRLANQPDPTQQGLKPVPVQHGQHPRRWQGG